MVIVASEWAVQTIVRLYAESFNAMDSLSALTTIHELEKGLSDYFHY